MRILKLASLELYVSNHYLLLSIKDFSPGYNMAKQSEDWMKCHEIDHKITV